MRTIINKIAELQLSLEIDELTKGDGNCFFGAIFQQLKRQELEIESCMFGSAEALRAAVCSFALSNSKHTTFIKSYKERYNEIEKPKWDTFFRKMKLDGVWACGPVAQVTAWLLQRDFWVISEGVTKDRPFLPLYGNRNGSGKEFASSYPPLILGNAESNHFQSFLPIGQSAKGELKVEDLMVTECAVVKETPRKGMKREHNEHNEIYHLTPCSTTSPHLTS